MAEFEARVRAAYELTGDPRLGLEVACQSSTTLLRVVGHVLATCSTLGQAYELFRRYAPLVDQEGRYELVSGGERACFSFASTNLDPWVRRFRAELCLGFTYRVAREQLQVAGRADEVWFEHSAPSYRRSYDELFDCPVRFDRPRNAIWFAADALSAPLPAGAPALNQVLREHADQVLGAVVDPDDLVAQVEGWLRARPSLDRVSASALARELSMAPRTLRRRLAVANARFSELLDRVRHQRALRELAADVAVKDLAERLGFSEPSAFHRAFRRWTGLSVGEYRARLNAAS